MECKSWLKNKFNQGTLLTKRHVHSCGKLLKVCNTLSMVALGWNAMSTDEAITKKPSKYTENYAVSMNSKYGQWHKHSSSVAENEHMRYDHFYRQALGEQKP